MIERASRTAEHEFAKRGFLTPAWVAIDKQGTVHAFPSSGHSKDLDVLIIRATFTALEVIRYVFVDEAWMLDRSMSDITKAELVEIGKHGLRDHPERKEIVMLSGEDHDAGQLTARRDIVRPPVGRPYLGPLIIDDGIKQSEGRMVGLLPVTGRTRQ
jgi:hypothetical protein